MPPPSALKVWGVGTTRTLRVHWALMELGLDYETVPVRARTPMMDEPDFLKINPDKKIPVLQDGSLTLSESPAIVLYLFENYPNSAGIFIPKSRHDKARILEWASYISMELDATSLYVIRRHLDLSDTYGTAPAAVAVAENYFARMVARADRALSDGRAYLFGDELSAADILLVSCFNLADRYGVEIPKEFAGYRARVGQRPTYQRAMKANTP